MPLLADNVEEGAPFKHFNGHINAHFLEVGLKDGGNVRVVRAVRNKQLALETIGEAGFLQQFLGLGGVFFDGRGFIVLVVLDGAGDGAARRFCIATEHDFDDARTVNG